MIEKLEKAEARFDKLEESLADPEIYKDQESYAALMKERKALTPVIEKYRAYKAAVAARDGAAELRDDAAQDSELRELAAAEFADAILQAKKTIHTCPVCQNLTDEPMCSICSDPQRDHGQICVVAEPKDVIAMERTREYHGLYHVLHGVISPLNHIGPDDIRIRELLDRVGKEEVREVIMATNPDTEGEATAMYLSRLLRPLEIKVTRLAYGIPVGSQLEYADEITLLRALEGRCEI